MIHNSCCLFKTYCHNSSHHISCHLHSTPCLCATCSQETSEDQTSQGISDANLLWKGVPSIKHFTSNTFISPTKRIAPELCHAHLRILIVGPLAKICHINSENMVRLGEMNEMRGEAVKAVGCDTLGLAVFT